MERIRRRSLAHSLFLAIAALALAGPTGAQTLPGPEGTIASTPSYRSPRTPGAELCPRGRTCEGAIEMGQLMEAGLANITGQYSCVGAADCSVLLWDGGARVGRAKVRLDSTGRTVESTLTLADGRTVFRYRGSAGQASRAGRSVRAQLQLCSLATTEVCRSDVALTYTCRSQPGACTPTTATVNGQAADPGQARGLLEATLQQTPLAALSILTVDALLGTPTALAPCGVPGTMLIKAGCKGDCIKDACSLCRGRIVGGDDYFCACDGNETCSQCVSKIYWDCAGGCTPWTKLVDAAVWVAGKALGWPL